MMSCEFPEPIGRNWIEEELVIRSQVCRVVEEMVEKIVFNNNEDILTQEALFGENDTDENDTDENELIITTGDDCPNFLTDRDVVRVLFSEEGEPIGEISRIGRRRGTYCDVCDCEQSEINARIDTENGPVDVLRFISANEDPEPGPVGTWICTSCSRFLDDGSSFCICCGLNENLGRQYGITFYEYEGSGNIYCVHCEDAYHDLDIGREQNADNIYDIEYENVEMPENNTEKVKKIKETVGELGDMMFDIQPKLTEGEYLRIMDLLQSVQNGVNSL